MVIDGIMVHDLFMVDGLCDDLCMELVCIVIYDNLGVILQNLYLIYLLFYAFMFHALNGLLKNFESQNDLKLIKF